MSLLAREFCVFFVMSARQKARDAIARMKAIKEGKVKASDLYEVRCTLDCGGGGGRHTTSMKDHALPLCGLCGWGWAFFFLNELQPHQSLACHRQPG